MAQKAGRNEGTRESVATTKLPPTSKKSDPFNNRWTSLSRSSHLFAIVHATDQHGPSQIERNETIMLASPQSLLLPKQDPILFEPMKDTALLSGTFASSCSREASTAAALQAAVSSFSFAWKDFPIVAEAFEGDDGVEFTTACLTAALQLDSTSDDFFQAGRTVQIIDEASSSSPSPSPDDDSRGDDADDDGGCQASMTIPEPRRTVTPPPAESSSSESPSPPSPLRPPPPAAAAAVPDADTDTASTAVTDAAPVGGTAAKRKRKHSKKVSFSTVLEIRSYPVTLTNHPCCVGGMAMECDWDCDAVECVDLDVYERFSQKRSPAELRLPYLERRRRLRACTGLTAAELLKRDIELRYWWTE